MAETMRPGIGVEIKQKELQETVKGIEAIEAEIRSDAASHAKRMGNKREKITKLEQDAKGAGANGKILTKLLKIRDLDRKKKEEEDDLSEAEQLTLHQYMHMMGMLNDDKDLRPRFKQDENRASAH